MAYPASRSSLPSGIAMSRSNVPRARSRWVVTAVMMNMMMNGKTPMNSQANRFSAAGSSSTYLSRIISTEGTAISITTVRGSCRSWVRIRRAADGLPRLPAHDRLRPGR